jgi:hypothetical protein
MQKFTETIRKRVHEFILAEEEVLKEIAKMDDYINRQVVESFDPKDVITGALWVNTVFIMTISLIEESRTGINSGVSV